MDVPFCFVKGKARLGALCHKKTATSVALTEVRGEDKAQLDLFQKNFKAAFNENAHLKKNWGGGKIGAKSTHQRELKQKAVEKEALKKANL